MSEINSINNDENDRINNLIKLSQNNDIFAFEELILQYEKRVYNIALRMFKNVEDAKDISQDVFLKLYNNIKKFDYKSSFSTWLYRITVNTCIDEIRKRKGKEEFSIDDTNENNNIKKEFSDNFLTPEENYMLKETRNEILDSINNLSEEHKIIIILRDLQGFSYNEISGILNISVGTVKSRISRARLQLKNILLKNREQTKKNSVNSSIKERRAK